jgi:hypothetical protein
MKRPLLSGLLILVIIATSGYSYYQIAYSKCRVPIAYDIGDIDKRFGITEEEARAALSDAESLWEDATGKNLFTYTEGGDLVVSFVYDERQATTIEEHELSAVLDSKAVMSESIRTDYETLLSGYEKLKREHTAKVAAYERRLAVHNDEVEKWNGKGGAPEGVYERLGVTSKSLNKESADLNQSAKTLNALVAKINDIGTKGNKAVEAYNNDVARYNDAFGNEREFTQGDYQNGAIKIYQFDDGTELRKVLAHELGHALGIEHVDDPTAVMYYLMEGQLAELSLAPADVAAYRDQCGTK